MDTVENGIIAFRDGDKQEGQSIFKRLSEMGNVEATELLVCSFDESDESKILYVKKGAELGSAYCQNLLGIYYDNHINTKNVNLEQSFFWYHEAAKQNHEIAQFNLGSMYYNGDGVPMDLEKSLYWCQQSANQNYAPAHRVLGIKYMNGVGTSKDVEMGVLYLKDACREDDCEACEILGRKYFKGIDVGVNLEESFRWHFRASELGSLESKHAIAIMYLRGDGVDKDIGKALNYLIEAAYCGYIDSEYILGRIYIEGIAVEKNKELGVKWLNKATLNDHQKARELLRDQNFPFNYLKEIKATFRLFFPRLTNLFKKNNTRMLNVNHFI